MVLDAQIAQFHLDWDEELGNEGTALLGALFQLLGDVLEIFRLEVFQSQILQLAFDAVKTQLVGDLCIEVHCLPTLLATLLGREDVERTHYL